MIGIDAGGLAFAVKLDGPVEIAVIGHGQGVHALLLGGATSSGIRLAPSSRL